MQLSPRPCKAFSCAALVLLVSACGSANGGGPADGNAGASGNAASGGDRGSGGTSAGGVSAKGGEIGNQGGNRASGGMGGGNAGGASGGEAKGGSAHGGANPGGSAGERATSGGVGGANRGGAGGSSGAAGSNTGGAAGSACPSAAPSVGEACAANGLDCAWGDSPFPECRTHLVCSLGKWANGFSGSECKPTAADMCPPVEPNRSGACTADDVGARCSYDGGSLCTCESQACGGTGCTPLTMPTWFCYRPPSNCPLAAPNVGTECSGNMTCNYEYCGLTASCRNGRWTWLFGCA